MDGRSKMTDEVTRGEDKHTCLEKLVQVVSTSASERECEL